MTFSVFRQGGRPGGSASELHERVAFVMVIVDGLIESMTTYSDIDEARAAAERLTQERAELKGSGQGVMCRCPV